MGAAFLDSRYVFPALFPSTDEPPRLGDFQLQSAKEGTPIFFCLGPENRIPGMLIWGSELIEEKRDIEAGGKGGGQSVTEYVYFVDLAIAVCEGEIDSFQKIWADGKLIYDADPDFNETSNLLSVEDAGKYGIGAEYMMKIHSTAAGPDLSLLISGKDVVVSGFANGNNNGTYRCSSSESLGSGGSDVYLHRTNAPTVEAAGASATLYQDKDVFDAETVGEFTFYTGSTTQTADSLIESHEGAGEVPAFRNIAYVVMNRLALQDFGNRIPQFSFLIKKDATKTIASAIESILSRAGLDASQYDTTAVSGNLRGFAIAGAQALKNPLEQLLLANDIVVTEADGKLTFAPRGSLSATSVAEVDLAAHELTGDAPRALTIIDGSDLLYPSEVNVGFIEAALDYQLSSEREKKVNAVTTSIRNIQLAIVMDADDARAIAKRELWTAWVQRQVLRFQLPPSYHWIKENTLLSIPVGNETYEVLVQQVDRGHNFQIAVEAVVAGKYTSTYIAPGVEGASFAHKVYSAPQMILYIMDLPPLQDDQNSSPSFYYAACCTENRKAADWHGGNVFESVDGTDYTRMRQLTAEAFMGFATGVLGSAPSGRWDNESTVQVKMYEGELETKTALAILNGMNRAMLGDEIIAFTTATLVDIRTYELSGLLRGLRNTESAIAGHAEGDPFVLLNQPGVEWKKINIASVGVTKYFKAVSSGGEVADADAVSGILNAQTVRPFGPAHVKGTRDASDNLTITWFRRTRAIMRHYGTAVTPSPEPDEEYSIDIYDNGSVVRTISVSDATTASYTAAQQTTDGLTPGDPVHLKIYQVSSSVGRGNVTDVTV